MVVDPVGDGRSSSPWSCCSPGAAHRSRTSGGWRDDFRPVRRPRSAGDRPQPDPRSRHRSSSSRPSSASSCWRLYVTRPVLRREVGRLHLHARLGADRPRHARARSRRSRWPASGRSSSASSWRSAGCRTTPGSGCRSTAIIEVLRAVPVLVFMFLLYYGLPVHRRQDAAVLGGRHRARRLQRLGARRGASAPGVESLPRGQSEAGLRDRTAQVRGHAARAAAAGDPRHAARHHRPAGRHAEGHRARLHHHLPRAAVLRALPRLATQRSDSPIVPADDRRSASIYIALCLILSLHRQPGREAHCAARRRSPRTPASVSDGDGTDTELIVDAGRGRQLERGQEPRV